MLCYKQYDKKTKFYIEITFINVYYQFNQSKRGPLIMNHRIEFHVNRGDTGREVTVNTRSNTEVSNMWPAGCMAETYLDFQIFISK